MSVKSAIKYEELFTTYADCENGWGDHSPIGNFHFCGIHSKTKTD